MDVRTPIYLIDASPYIFRAFYSIPQAMRSPDGRAVNATYGFGAFLLSLLEKERPSHAAIAFDESLTTSFRNEILAAYKAHRPLPPEELEVQLRDCRALAEALGLACYASERYEADDLIAALALRHAPAGHEVVVVTSDKDLLQLVGPCVSVLDAARGLRLGPAEVFGKLGVRPDQVVDYLALAGDAVDAIPGVRGVGPKTAAQLLARFGTLDDLFARLPEVETSGLRGAASIRRRLEEGREAALLSRRLAAAAPEAPTPEDLEALRWRGPSERLVEAAFGRLGLTGLAKRARALGAPKELDG